MEGKITGDAPEDGAKAGVAGFPTGTLWGASRSPSERFDEVSVSDLVVCSVFLSAQRPPAAAPRLFRIGQRVENPEDVGSKMRGLFMFR